MPASTLAPGYLLTGSDQPKIALAVRRLRARFDPGSIVDLAIGPGKEDASADDVVATLNAPALFGGGERLVVVTEIARLKAADLAVLAAYLEAPAVGSVLALVGEPSKGSRLEALVARAGEVLRFDVPQARGRRLDFTRWVEDQLERHGARANRGVARALVDEVGEDTFALQSEVEKLVTWSGGEEITSEAARALAAGTNEATAFALADAWGTRDARGLLAACEAELSRPDDPFLIGVRLAGHVARVRAVRSLLDEGVELATVMGRLGLKEYPAKKAAEHGRHYTDEELDDVLVVLARLDHDLKGASRLPGDLLLELALVETVRSREDRRRKGD